MSADSSCDVQRPVFTTNHKDMVTMYLMFSRAMWFIGGTVAMLWETPPTATVITRSAEH